MVCMIFITRSIAPVILASEKAVTQSDAYLWITEGPVRHEYFEVSLQPFFDGNPLLIPSGGCKLDKRDSMICEKTFRSWKEDAP